MNDHLAGSAAAVELVERIRDNNEGTDLARAMESLLADIEADQATLAAIMERLGVDPSSPQQAAGKVLETLSRFRLNERVTGSAEVSMLMELETLSLGIEGKLALWRSLSEVTGALAALAEFDLPTLAARAVSQRAVVEPFRLQAAGAALA